MSHTIAHSNIFHRHEATHFSPLYSCLIKGGIKVFSDLASETIHCTAGHLWVTLEGDTDDHVLYPGEQLEVPNQGKVIVSGPGCYRISKSIDGMDLSVAS